MVISRLALEAPNRYLMRTHRMARADRLAVITELQELRHSHLIAYITSTRPNLEVQMAMDSIRRIFEHVKAIGKPKDEVKIDLFLHSNGGDGTVPWRLVTLLREFANRFTVLVPYKAFSAATLTALKMPWSCIPWPCSGQLTQQLLMISTRKIHVIPIDGILYQCRRCNRLHCVDQGRRRKYSTRPTVEVIKVLSEKVHPLALGNVAYPSHSRE